MRSFWSNGKSIGLFTAAAKRGFKPTEVIVSLCFST
jgi:hypothetical protein